MAFFVPLSPMFDVLLLVSKTADIVYDIVHANQVSKVCFNHESMATITWVSDTRIYDRIRELDDLNHFLEIEQIGVQLVSTSIACQSSSVHSRARLSGLGTSSCGSKIQRYRWWIDLFDLSKYPLETCCLCSMWERFLWRMHSNMARYEQASREENVSFPLPFSRETTTTDPEQPAVETSHWLRLCAQRMPSYSLLRCSRRAWAIVLVRTNTMPDLWRARVLSRSKQQTWTSLMFRDDVQQRSGLHPEAIHEAGGDHRRQSTTHQRQWATNPSAWSSTEEVVPRENVDHIHRHVISI